MKCFRANLMDDPDEPEVWIVAANVTHMFPLNGEDGSPGTAIHFVGGLRLHVRESAEALGILIGTY